MTTYARIDGTDNAGLIARGPASAWPGLGCRPRPVGGRDTGSSSRCARAGQCPAMEFRYSRAGFRRAIPAR